MGEKRTTKEKILYILISVVFIAGMIYAMYIRNRDNLPTTSGNSEFLAYYFDAFDTQTAIRGYAKSEEEFYEITDKIAAELKKYNNLYDIYHSYEGINNLKTINDNAGLQPVQVEDEIIDLLKFSIELYKNTKGQTNIALGSVLKIWHEYRTLGIEEPEKAALPEEAALKAAAEHTDINKIEIDEVNKTVFLRDPEMSLDVGSIGKGYAAQKVMEYAAELGVSNMVISVGGNICALGAHENGTPWRLGVQNPDTSSSQEFVETVNLPNRYCIVTSGNYQRYYEVDGKRYCHIIDPDTLYSADYFAAVSIITNNSGAADALSTAVYCMTVEEGMEFINNLPGVEAMWILHDGSKKYSDDFNKYIS